MNLVANIAISQREILSQEHRVIITLKGSDIKMHVVLLCTQLFLSLVFSEAISPFLRQPTELLCTTHLHLLSSFLFKVGVQQKGVHFDEHLHAVALPLCCLLIPHHSDDVFAIELIVSAQMSEQHV